MSDQKLTKDKLQTAEAVLSLGLVVVKELDAKGIITIFINENGEVELCPIEELMLDSLEHNEALSRLIDLGYEDEQLIAYLKGRRARGKYSGQDM